MNETELEEAIRELCDNSGLNNGEVGGVLDVLKVGYEMLVEAGSK